MGQVSLGLKRRLPSSFSFLARLRFIDPAALLIANEFWSELTIRTLDSQSVQSQSHSFCSFVFACSLVLHFSFRFRIARPTLTGPRKHYRRSLDQVSGTLIFIIVPPFTTLFLPLAITCRNTFVSLICFATSACGNYEMILLLLLGFFTSQESASRSTFNRHFYALSQRVVIGSRYIHHFWGSFHWHTNHVTTSLHYFTSEILLSSYLFRKSQDHLSAFWFHFSLCSAQSAPLPLSLYIHIHSKPVWLHHGQVPQRWHLTF